MACAASNDGRELSLHLAAHGALEADQQLLVQHCCDALEGGQLRYVGALLQSRYGAMGRARRLRDFRLSEPEIEPAFT